VSWVAKMSDMGEGLRGRRAVPVAVRSGRLLLLELCHHVRQVFWLALLGKVFPYLLYQLPVACEGDAVSPHRDRSHGLVPHWRLLGAQPVRSGDRQGGVYLRRGRLKIQATWPRADAITAAWQRIDALPQVP